MSRFKVLQTDRAWPDTPLEQEILEEVDAELVAAPDGREETLIDLARDADVIFTNWAKVTEKVIEATTRCRLICRTGIGLDNIAIPAATRRGILVTNVPDYCVEEVADHTLALLLGLARKIAFYHQRTKAGEYRLQAGPSMHRLRTQTLGLIGLGRIGQAVAQRAKGFGLTVLGNTSSGSDHGTGLPMVSLEELLARSDYLSLHAPLTDATRHLLGPEKLQKVKPHVGIINTSRGPLIDPAALWQALQENRVGGAALDVFEPEPPDLSQPLYRDERVIVTPHAAFVSEESLTELRTRVAHQAVDCLSGKQPPHIVNPEAIRR